jgi:hypothetical protein
MQAINTSWCGISRVQTGKTVLFATPILHYPPRRRLAREQLPRRHAQRRVPRGPHRGIAPRLNLSRGRSTRTVFRPDHVVALLRF